MLGRLSLRQELQSLRIRQVLPSLVELCQDSIHSQFHSASRAKAQKTVLQRPSHSAQNNKEDLVALLQSHSLASLGHESTLRKCVLRSTVQDPSGLAAHQSTSLHGIRHATHRGDNRRAAQQDALLHGILWQQVHLNHLVTPQELRQGAQEFAWGEGNLNGCPGSSYWFHLRLKWKVCRSKED